MKYEKVSDDEVHESRKEFTNDAGVMAKGVPVAPEITKAVKFNDTTRTGRFVMSAEMPDRMGDIVVQEGLDVANFQANPVGLLFHNSRSWPVGTWKDVEKSLTGRPKRTEGSLVLLPKGADADADRTAEHLKAGTMRTVSIGFRPKRGTTEVIRDDDNRFVGYRFNESELLECSVVPIPALPAATMKELSAGMLSAESKELIKGVLESFALKDGEVLDRSQLEGAVREAEGNRTTHVINLKALPVGSILRKEEDGTIMLVEKAGDPPAPADGEEVPVAPDPAAGEKQKAEDAQAESVAAFNAHTMTVAREHAMRSQEPGLWAKFLAALAPAPAAPVERAEPELDIPEPAGMGVEEKAALEERIANRIRATERAIEPA